MKTLALMMAVLFAAPAAAQERGRTFSLEQVLALARTNNRDLRVARTRLEQAAISVDQAWVALYPQAVAQGRYTHNNKEVSIDPSRFGGGGGGMGMMGMMGMTQPTSPIVIQKGEQLDASATVSVPLVVPWAYSGLTAARANNRAAGATLAVTEIGVLLAAAQTFYQAAGGDEVLRARQSAIEVARRGWNDAKIRLAAGNVTSVDVARAELALVRAEQAAREAEFGRVQSYRALATVAQIDGDFTVAIPPVVAASVPAADLEGTLRLRPEFGVLEASLQAAGAQARSSAWRWAPSLSAFGTARAGNYSGFSGDAYSWAVGATLDWALFDGGLRDVQRRTARAQQREVAERVLLLRDSIRDELANARLLVDTRRAGVESAQRSVELARATLDLVRVQYEAGATTQLYLLQAQDSLVAAEVSLAQSRYELATADLAVRRAAGTFP